MSQETPSEETLSETARRMALAAVEREIAEFERRDALPVRRVRRDSGGSIVYSIRLDPREVRLIEERAAMPDILPTMLARNLIRSGLAAGNAPALADAVDRLGQAVDEVRSLI